MSSHTQQLAPMGGLPVEILEQVAEEILTTRSLVNFACTCSTINSIIQQKPLLFYQTDLRFQRLRRTDKEIEREYPPQLPSLIHAIYRENSDTFKVVFKMYKKHLSRTLMNRWPTDESGKRLAPTPHVAAINADHFNAFWQLYTSHCPLRGSEWDLLKDHPFFERGRALFAEMDPRSPMANFWS